MVPGCGEPSLLYGRAPQTDVLACRKDGSCGEAPLVLHTWRARNGRRCARRHKVCSHMQALHSGRVALGRRGQLTGSPQSMMEFGRGVAYSCLERSIAMEKRPRILLIWPRPH